MALIRFTVVVTLLATAAPSLPGIYIPFYKERRAIGEEQSCIDFGFHFGIQREEHIAEIPQIVKQTGVKSFKLYFGYEVENPIGIVPANDGWVYSTMQQVSKIPGGVVSVHCEGWRRVPQATATPS